MIALTRGKVKKSKILRLALLAFVGYIAVSFIIVQVDISKRRENLAAVEQELAQQEYLNDEMRSILDSGTDTKYIMRMAREKLGFVFPDERVFIDPNRKQ